MRTRVWLVLLLLVVSACSGPTDQESAREAREAQNPGPPLGTGTAAVPRLDWRPCGSFQCATLTVPVDYRTPTGPTIALDVTRLPALDPATRIGTVAVNYGGPGTPGPSSLRRLAGRFDGVRARMDVLALQPRGIDQVRCGPDDAAPAQPIGSPLSDPAAFWSSARAIGQACLAGTGELLRHLSTANAARDLDLLRQALGEPTLSVYGYSYGTYLGATYANLFPGRLRALVVDGALDLVANAGAEDPTRPVDVRADVARARDEAVDAFVAACVAAGPRCAANPDPADRVAAAVGAATRAGTSAQLAGRVSTALESGGRLTALARTFPPSGPVPPVPDPAAGAPPHSPAFLAVQCTDVRTPTAEQMTALLPAEQAAHPLFGAPVALNTAACVDWPAFDPDRYLGPWNAPLPAPALVVNSRYDPETPLANARATATQLAGARLLVVDGFGHTTLDLPSRCATDAASAYLLDPTRLPAEGTVCPPDPGGVPFP